MERVLSAIIVGSLLIGAGYTGFVEYNKQVTLVEKNQKRVLTLLEKLSAEKSVNTEQEIKIYTLAESKKDLKKKLEGVRKKNVELEKEISRLKK